MIRHSINNSRIKGESIWPIIIAGILSVIIILQLLTLNQVNSNHEQSDIHSIILNWSPKEIPSDQVLSGYVASWEPEEQIRIVAVQVWMGNPSGITWEGDVYVTLNDQGDFHSPDQVIVHYQFDKHAESSLPHQIWFQVGFGDSGFSVKKGQTVWVWSAFKNTSNQSTLAGDGQVIIYYLIVKEG